MVNVSIYLYIYTIHGSYGFTNCFKKIGPKIRNFIQAGTWNQTASQKCLQCSINCKHSWISSTMAPLCVELKMLSGATVSWMAAVDGGWMGDQPVASFQVQNDAIPCWNSYKWVWPGSEFQAFNGLISCSMNHSFLGVFQVGWGRFFYVASMDFFIRR